MSDRGPQLTEKEVGTLIKGLIEAWNRQDVQGLVSHVTPDYIYHADVLPRPLVGREAYAKLLEDSFATIPDNRLTEVSHVCYSGNSVHFVFLSQGNKTDGFMGLPPIDKPYSFEVSNIYNFDKNLKATESWAYWNPAVVLKDLGAIPEIVSPWGGADAPKAASCRDRPVHGFGTNPGAGPFDSRAHADDSSRRPSDFGQDWVQGHNAFGFDRDPAESDNLTGMMMETARIPLQVMARGMRMMLGRRMLWDRDDTRRDDW